MHSKSRRLERMQLPRKSSEAFAHFAMNHMNPQQYSALPPTKRLPGNLGLGSRSSTAVRTTQPPRSCRTPAERLCHGRWSCQRCSRSCRFQKVSLSLSLCVSLSLSLSLSLSPSLPLSLYRSFVRSLSLSLPLCLSLSFSLSLSLSLMRVLCLLSQAPPPSWWFVSIETLQTPRTMPPHLSMLMGGAWLARPWLARPWLAHPCASARFEPSRLFPL